MPAASDFSIKPFVEDDLTLLTHLVNETIEQAYAGIYPPKAVRYFHDYHARVNILRDAAAGIIVIGWHGDSPAATGTMVGNYVSRVFVGNGYRGLGYGKMIALEIEQQALARGINQLELDASLTSRSFWERLGWRVTAREVEMVEDEPLEYYKMIKVLATSKSV
jgi:GNAT superfamily N-acetyltransferase